MSRPARPSPAEPRCNHRSSEVVGLTGKGQTVRWCRTCGAVYDPVTGWRYSKRHWRRRWGHLTKGGRRG